MKLNISQRIVRAGDIIEVSWDCRDVDQPRLVLHTGSRESTLAIPPTGQKRFRMKGSKGRHSIGIRYVDSRGRDRLTSRRLFVYGRVPDTDTFEYVDRGDSAPFRRWRQGVKGWWNAFTPEKKRLYILLLLLLAYNLLLSLPVIQHYAFILFYGILFWLFWQVVRRD